jgi:two-component system KDP operon response regulator KdpE
MDDDGKVVLVVEDEPPMRRLLHVTLKQHGYRVVEAATGKVGIEFARTRTPSIVLLDLGLPDVDGIEVIDAIRRTSRVPIVVISARDAVGEKVNVLDRGVNDYITKPFGSEELLARMRVALRYAGNGAASEAAKGRFTVGELRVDFDMRMVTSGGKEVHLTRTEYNLLSELIVSAGKVVTHRHLLERVWGPGFTDQLHYLRVYMKQLRDKIEPQPASPRYLVTEPTVGYRLRVPV